MPLWENVPQNVWGELTANSGKRRYRKGEEILREGAYSEGIYIIRKGMVKIFIINNLGDEQIIYILGENYIFGYSSLLSDEPSTIFASAITDCEIELIHKDSLKEQLKKSIELNSIFLNYAGQLYRIMNNKLTIFSRKPLNERVAMALLLLNQKLALNGTISFSREDLANYVGTALESLVRQLKKLKETGIIAVKGRNITILDMDKLYLIANEELV